MQPRGYIVDFHIPTFPVAHIYHRCDIIACAFGSNWHVKSSLGGGLIRDETFGGGSVSESLPGVFSAEPMTDVLEVIYFRQCIKYNCKSVSIKHYFRARPRSLITKSQKSTCT